MPAEKVIVVRHGKYKGDALLPDGVRQMKALVERLHQHVFRDSIIILSSTVPFVEQSTQILAHWLVGDHTYYESFPEFSPPETDAPEVSKMVFEFLSEHCEKTLAKTVIVVTQGNYMGNFMYQFMRNSGEFEIPPILDYGCAYIFDRVKKSYSQV